jgi:hypothetical protein
LLKLPTNNYKIGDKVVYIKDYDIMVEEKNTYLLLGENSVTKKNADGDIVEFRFDKIDTNTKFRIIRLMRCISLKLKLDLAQGGLH